MMSRLSARWKSAGWNEFVLFVSVAALCTGVWLFIHLTSVVAHETHQQTEERLMLALRDPADPVKPAGPAWLEGLGRDVTALGGATVVVTLTLLVIFALALRCQWGRIVLIVVTVGGGYALSATLKLHYDRPRPDIVPHLAEVSSASFPSGHSMLSSVVYLTLGALLAQASARRWEKIYFVAVAFLLTFLIGLSRVLLGVHYPTDVLAGWSAGTAWALLCWLVASRWLPRPADAGQ